MNNYSIKYNNSWALCIGINKYKNASPLNSAVNDAQEVAKIFKEDYLFEDDKVILLLDENATRELIIKTYLSLSSKVDLNDRIIFYFAGHGHTIIGKRGEIGFLVPHDGDTNEVSSLLRWDDLTRNSELIPAKHMFFILDACFSGLAVTRALPRGSMRFLNDMFKRYSRQVIAAGKANQTVSDSGGPLPDHSIFTGYLIKGLKGDAKGTDSIITANGLMSFLYEKVSKDHMSYQTPHFGFFDGDGDLIFTQLEIKEKSTDEGADHDILFEVPSTYYERKEEETVLGFLERAKEYISDSKYRIKLDDLITIETKQLLSLLNIDRFQLDGSFKREEEIRETLKIFENITKRLRSLFIAISFWGNSSQKNIQLKSISRLCDHLSLNNNTANWGSLRWYSIILEIYSIGIPYLINEDYDSLYKLFMLPVTSFESPLETDSLIYSYGRAHSEINYDKTIKQLSEHERHYTPLSEYLFKTIQPLLEDILFLGKSYEAYFDKLEILIGLAYSDFNGNKEYGNYWGPLGRYAWKYRSRSRSRNPFSNLKEEAFSKRENWKILKAGFFNSSFERAEKTFTEFENVMQRLEWY